jgi:hypothetical protein
MLDAIYLNKLMPILMLLIANMKKLFTLLILIAGFQPVFAQNAVLKFVQNMYVNKDTTKKSGLLILPSISSSPENGTQIGTSVLYSFYTDTALHSITRLSNIYLFGNISSKGQQREGMNISYWRPLNTWHYTMLSGYINYPFNFYGIGNNTRNANKESIEEKRTRFDFEAEKKIMNNLYVGLVFGVFKYYYYSGTSTQNIPFKTNPLIQNHLGGSGLYAGPDVTYDSRNNNTYTTKGLYVGSYFELIQGLYGNNSYNGGLFAFKYSQFFLLNKKLVLGFNAQEQSLTGYRSPFYLLPQLGSDALMRGYYAGRYRDRNFIAAQAELRYRILNRCSIVAFVGTGEVAHNSFTAKALKPNCGGGLRYFFDPKKGLSIRADYGIGEKPVGEPTETGLYLGLGEAF